jgi:hypothetical protein
VPLYSIHIFSLYKQPLSLVAIVFPLALFQGIGLVVEP